MDRRIFLGLMASGAASSLMAHTSTKEHAVWIRDEEVNTFLSVSKKIDLVKRYVGYGNFNILSYEDMLKTAKRYPKIGYFTPVEIAFIEKMFYENPSKYGFYGKRTVTSLNNTVNKKEILKIPHTGHYLFKGNSEGLYERVISDVGKSLILTSGIRNVPKQMNLYFNKIRKTGGNITLASKSLAPAGYSYHTIGDFDVGKKGWGYKNFTVKFITTKEFWRLRRLSYVSIRYTPNNRDGVRFEPWHVKTI